MASSTLGRNDGKSPATPHSPSTFKFPAFQHDLLHTHYEEDSGLTSSRTPSPHVPSNVNGGIGHDRWQARQSSRPFNHGASHSHAGRHGRQKSLSEAIRTIRTRRGSVSQNAHEIADALKAPISPMLIILCGVWYTTSIMSNTSSKAILTALPKPITLTLVQFGFVSSWCLFLAWLAKIYPRLKRTIPVLKNGIRPPSRDLIMTTLPLTAFQIGGHIMSSDAMSRIDVSLVHTIKGLSPLFTVLAYRIFLGINYSYATYLSLIPLTFGVILACCANFSANFIGVLYAFGSALLFVTQNIVSKKIFNEAALAEQDGAPLKNRKPDKLNLLCYSSGMAFVFTFPLWLWSEGFTLIADFLHDASIDISNKPGALDHGALTMEFFFNGTFHFGQNLVAFVLLSMVSPVTYSVASLIKRVFVICFALVWYGSMVSTTQGFGIALTFLGLYLYDRVSDADKADRKARMMQMKEHNKSLLPLSTKITDGPMCAASPMTMQSGHPFGGANGGIMRNPDVDGDEKRNDDYGPGRVNGNEWLPPGTKQEDTWRRSDIAPSPQVRVT